MAFNPATTTVTLGAANANLAAGVKVSGAGIPPGATVASYTASGPSIVLSAAITATLASTALSFDPSTTVITLAGANANLAAGVKVVGAGIPAGATVASYASGGASHQHHLHPMFHCVSLLVSINRAIQY